MPRSKVLNTVLNRLAVFILLSSGLLCKTAHAETIKLKSGSIITAQIIEQTTDYIKLDLDGVVLTYYKDEIESISAEPLNTAKTLPKQAGSTTTSISNLKEKISKSVVIIQANKKNMIIEGTGFFVSSDGLIATNLHVVFNATSIMIRTQEGETYPVQFIANYNDELDICLLKIDITNAPALPLGNSENLTPGQILFTIGHREGSFYQTSSGPFVGQKIIDSEKNLQSKIVSGHGNSGGPILDQEGNVVGISKAFSPDSGNNFGIPINEAKNFLAYNEPLTVGDFNRKISPANALTYAAQGAFLAGKFKQALEDFQKALDLDPKYLKALIGTAKSYSALDMKKEALGAWQEVNKRDPNNLSALIHLGKLYLTDNMLDQAIDYLQKAAALNAQATEIYSDLGFAYGQQGKLNEAIAAYKKGAQLNPQDADCHYNLAVAYFNKQNFTKAKEYSQKAQHLGYAIPESFLKQLSSAEKFGNTFEIK